MRKIVRWALAAFFTAAGANHFLLPAAYLKMMPAYLPYPLPLIYASGFLESAFGLGLLFPRRKRAAAWGLVLMLILIFPANLNMALHSGRFPAFAPWVLWLRLPLQCVLIWLVLWAARE